MTKEEFGHQIQLHGFIYESTLYYKSYTVSCAVMCCAKYVLQYHSIVNTCTLYDRIKNRHVATDDIRKLWNDEVEKYKTKLDNLNKLKKVL